MFSDLKIKLTATFFEARANYFIYTIVAIHIYIMFILHIFSGSVVNFFLLTAFTHKAYMALDVLEYNARSISDHFYDAFNVHLDHCGAWQFQSPFTSTIWKKHLWSTKARSYRFETWGRVNTWVRVKTFLSARHEVQISAVWLYSL